MIAAVAVLYATTALAQDTTTKHTTNTPFTLSGYVETYYSYDNNKPADHYRPVFVYSHNRSNEFAVNLAFVKGNYTADRVRANMALAAGTYMNANYTAEPGLLKNLYEANVGYKLSANKNLWLDVGILPSHIGTESAVSKDCWTLTRSIQGDNMPYYETGAKLTYITKNDKWLLSAMALNGWQRIQRLAGNSLMSWGTQVQFKPNSKVTINYSTFIGADAPDSTRQLRFYHDLYSIWQLNEKLGVTFGVDVGQQQANKGSRDYHIWYAPVAVVRFTPADKWAVAVRGEYYNDKHGVIINTGTANGFRIAGLSANLDYLPMKNIALRVEAKQLNSRDAVFVKNKEATASNTVITFSVAAGF